MKHPLNPPEGNITSQHMESTSRYKKQMASLPEALSDAAYFCSVVNNGGKNNDVVIVCRELERLFENLAAAGIRRVEVVVRPLAGEGIRAVCTLMRKNKNKQYVLRPLGVYQQVLRELYLAHRGDAKRRPLPVQILWLMPKQQEAAGKDKAEGNRP